MKLLLISMFSIVLAGYQGGALKPSLKFSSHKNNSYVIVLGDNFHYFDEIKLAVNGNLETTGDCTPTPKLGLLRRNDKNGWDTLIHVETLGTLMCGFGTQKWETDTVTTGFADHYRSWYGAEYSGTYCFTYIVIQKHKSAVRSTNEFKVDQ